MGKLRFTELQLSNLAMAMSSLLEVLFDEAVHAHHDFVNDDGKTAIDMAQTDETRRILSEKRKVELKCISARAVKKNWTSLFGGGAQNTGKIH